MSKSNKELQQDPTMADHLDYKAEIITGMVAMWAISSLKLLLLAITCCSSLDLP